MRERSELARKGIARGRSVVVLAYAGGVLFVAENPSRSLQKVSELYDRVGFAAVGRFNEFDNLRRGGIQFADTRGYAYDRRDVTGRQLANVYAQTLGTIFTEQAKPYEVELCVAEVAHYGETKAPELYRITYDGSIADEPHFVVMGGTTEPIIAEAQGVLRGERQAGRRGQDRGQRAARHGGNGSDSPQSRTGHAGGGHPRREPAPAGVPAHHRSRAGSAAAPRGGKLSGVDLSAGFARWPALDELDNRAHGLVGGSALLRPDPLHLRVEERLGRHGGRDAPVEVLDLDAGAFVGGGRKPGVGHWCADGVAECRAGDIADWLVAEEHRLVSHHD